MLRSLIKEWYYWFWHDVCKRPEPFTHTMRRSIKQHPKLWIGIPVGGFVTWWLLMSHLAGWW